MKGIYNLGRLAKLSLRYGGKNVARMGRIVKGSEKAAAAAAKVQPEPKTKAAPKAEPKGQPKAGTTSTEWKPSTVEVMNKTEGATEVGSYNTSTGAVTDVTKAKPSQVKTATIGEGGSGASAEDALNGIRARTKRLRTSRKVNREVKELEIETAKAQAEPAKAKNIFNKPYSQMNAVEKKIFDTYISLEMGGLGDLKAAIKDSKSLLTTRTGIKNTAASGLAFGTGEAPAVEARMLAKAPTEVVVNAEKGNIFNNPITLFDRAGLNSQIGSSGKGLTGTPYVFKGTGITSPLRNSNTFANTFNGGLVALRSAFVAPQGENPLITQQRAPMRRAATIGGLIVGGAFTAAFGVPTAIGTTLALTPIIAATGLNGSAQQGTVTASKEAENNTVAGEPETITEEPVKETPVQENVVNDESVSTPGPQDPDFTNNFFFNKATFLQNLATVTPKLGKMKMNRLARKADKLFDEVKAQTNKQFITLARQAHKDGKALPGSQDYYNLFLQNFRKALGEDAYLSQYATIVESSLQSASPNIAGSIVTKIKFQDEQGEIMPENFAVEIEFADKKAASQWNKLNITDDETLMFVKAKDGSYELVLAKPDGSKRGIYEPFIEGGKTGAEADYYRVISDLQNGVITNDGKTPILKIRLYSDRFFELLARLAGITEGFGGLPQSTVSQQATALGMSDPKDLQKNVSHSQLGNVSSVIFTGLQKTLGLKNTLSVGLLGSSVGLGLCAAAVAAPSLPAKIAGLAAGSFILGVFTNGAVKPSNSIFIKENSNDSATGTARTGFANAGASIGTMTGYLFFPVTTLIALSDIKAFVALYGLAAIVPGIAFTSLLLSKTRNYSPIKPTKPGLAGELPAFGKRFINVFPNIIHNTLFAFSGGYKERAAEITGNQERRAHKQEYEDLIEETQPVEEETIEEAPATAQDEQIANGNEEQPAKDPGAFNNIFKKLSNFFTVAIPAAGSQYLVKMMATVALYHFAGMMFNSGPGAIIGKWIQTDPGMSFVTAFQNSPIAGIGLAATLGYFGAKILLALARTTGIIKPQEENPAAKKDGTKDFFKKNGVPLAGAAALGLTSGIFPSTALHLTQNLTPTAVGSLLTFGTAYLGVYLGRQYLSQLVKKGKLSPQGIIGGSGALSTITTGLAFIPGLPIGVRMALWGIAGLGFANLAGYENALAIDRYPNEKPAVTMAYTLARLSGAATVFYGSLAKNLAAHGVASPDIYALALPFAALTLATLLNGKHIGTFAQEMKRLVTRPITSQVIQNKQDEILAKDAENGIEREHDDLVNTIATQLYSERSHNLSSLDKEINAINQESQRNQVRDAVFAKLKGMQSTAPADAKELTYDIFMKYEIDPLMKALDNKGVTASSIRFTEVAKAIASHYRVTPEALNAIEAKIEAEHKTAQKDIRLDVLNAIRTMELDRTAGGDNLEPQPAQ